MDIRSEPILRIAQLKQPLKSILKKTKVFLIQLGINTERKRKKSRIRKTKKIIRIIRKIEARLK